MLEEERLADDISSLARKIRRPENSLTDEVGFKRMARRLSRAGVVQADIEILLFCMEGHGVTVSQDFDEPPCLEYWSHPV